MSSAQRLAADIMIRSPKTLPARALVREARSQLGDDHVHMALLVEHGRLVGTLIGADLPESADDQAPALSYATMSDRTVAPTRPAGEVHRSLRLRGERRVAVTDVDGHLLGLICLNRRLTGFCSDEDVAARAADGPGMRSESRS